MYIAGRLRTASISSRTWISSAVYFACAISVDPLADFGVRERHDRHRLRHDDELVPLDDLVPLSAARLHLLRIRVELEALAALRGLEHELIALRTGDEADHRVLGIGLDHGDAAAGAFELRDLVGLAVEHVAVARRRDDD